MTRRKRAWNWAVAVALVIFGGASAVTAQSSLQGGGLSTKAILALEECFDAFQNFTCGAAVGGITGAGTDGRNTRFTGAATIADGSFLDDGTNATLKDDVEFIIGETATAGTVGGITWNTFAGGGVERLEIDGTSNAGVLITHGVGFNSGGFIVADNTGSFIHTFSQQAPRASGDSGNAWNFTVDGPTDMDGAADQRIGIDLDMESNAGDVAGAQQIGFFLETPAATAATQDAFLFETGSGWDNDIVKGTETVRTALNFATPSGSNTITIPAASGTMALTSGIPTVSGTTDTLSKFTSASAVGDSDLDNDGVPVAGASGNVVDLTVTANAMNGSDTFNGFVIAATNADHTGTGNTFNAYLADDITEDPDATEVGFSVGSGFDYMVVSAVRTVAVADNVGTNEVGLFFDESTDRVGGAGADCALVARLSSGAEVNVAILVTDGGCP